MICDYKGPGRITDMCLAWTDHALSACWFTRLLVGSGAYLQTAEGRDNAEKKKAMELFCLQAEFGVFPKQEVCVVEDV